MANKFADVSSYQPANLAYYKGLKADGAKFCFVKLTEGNYWLSPTAYKQIKACQEVFHSVGVYHFWHGESAHYFLGWLKSYAKYLHFSLSNVHVALDVESGELSGNVTPGINRFETQLVHAGIKPANIWTYTMGSWLNEGKVVTSELKYGFLWEALYPSVSAYFNNSLSSNSKYNPKANAWQFSGINCNQDWDYDYTNTLKADESEKDKVKPKAKQDKPKAKKTEKKPEPKKTVSKPVKHYAHQIGYYKTLVDKVGVYEDYDLHHKLTTLPKNYTFYGEPVLNGAYTRLLTRSGNYITGNLIYIKLG